MNRFIVILLLFCLSGSVYAQSENETKAVQQPIINLFEALSNRDAAGLRNNCTTDVRFYEYGQAWTVDTLINKAITKNTAADFVRTNKIDFVSTTIKNDVAWTTYNLHSDIKKGDKSVSIHWLETVILVQEEKRWKIKVLHSTRVN